MLLTYMLCYFVYASALVSQSLKKVDDLPKIWVSDKSVGDATTTLTTGLGWEFVPKSRGYGLQVEEVERREITSLRYVGARFRVML